ncbi:hypothetical protein SNEBB_010265 [Seison nebaliae]|nr:hypothetical protein SNEBB_010265 [Seison nebaliae]
MQSLDSSLKKMSNEKRLIDTLLSRYPVKWGRPVKRQDDVITVFFGLSLSQLLDLDEKNQVLTTNMWITYKWIDFHLAWNPSHYGNITSVRIPPEHIWTPDIVLYNHADTRIEEKRPCLAVIEFNGSVLWLPQTIVKSTCNINIKSFPYDEQVCKLKFGSWTYDGLHLDLEFDPDTEEAINFQTYIPNNEWIIVMAPGFRSVFRYDCCSTPFPDLSYYIFLKRQGGFYNYLLVLPCVLLSSLTLVLFWLPPESPSKLTLGMDIFVAFFLLLILLSDSTPPASSQIPMLGAYYCANMILIAASTFFCTIIVNIYLRGDKRGRAPIWVRKIFIHFLAHVYCMNWGSVSSTIRPIVPQPSVSPSPNNTTTSVTSGKRNVDDGREMERVVEKKPLERFSFAGDQEILLKPTTSTVEMINASAKPPNKSNNKSLTDLIQVYNEPDQKSKISMLATTNKCMTIDNSWKNDNCQYNFISSAFRSNKNRQMTPHQNGFSSTSNHTKCDNKFQGNVATIAINNLGQRRIMSMVDKNNCDGKSSYSTPFSPQLNNVVYDKDPSDTQLKRNYLSERVRLRKKYLSHTDNQSYNHFKQNTDQIDGNDNGLSYFYFTEKMNEPDLDYPSPIIPSKHLQTPIAMHSPIQELSSKPLTIDTKLPDKSSSHSINMSVTPSTGSPSVTAVSSLRPNKSLMNKTKNYIRNRHEKRLLTETNSLMTYPHQLPTKPARIPPMPGTCTCSMKNMEKDLREIRDYMRRTRKRLEIQEVKNRIASEWKIVALTLDRTFFLFYVLTIIFSIIIIFPRPASVPLYQQCLKNDRYVCQEETHIGLVNYTKFIEEQQELYELNEEYYDSYSSTAPVIRLTWHRFVRFSFILIYLLPYLY